MPTDNGFIKQIERSTYITESTKKVYIKNIRRACDDIMGGVSISHLLKHPFEFGEKLRAYGPSRKDRGIHSLDLTVASVLSIWKYNPLYKDTHNELYNEWCALKAEIFRPVQVKYLSNEPTDRQKREFIPFEKLVEIRDSLPKGSRARLLIALYTMIPPIRSDYDAVRIYCTQDEIPPECDHNYIFMDFPDGNNATLVLHEYKTAYKYGVLKIPIPQALHGEIVASFGDDCIEDSYLFERKGGVMYSPNTFNKMANASLKRATGNPHISLTTLRHIYLTRSDINLMNMSGLEREKIARIMGHSISTQGCYSWHCWDKK